MPKSITQQNLPWNTKGHDEVSAMNRTIVCEQLSSSGHFLIFKILFFQKRFSFLYCFHLWRCLQDVHWRLYYILTTIKEKAPQAFLWILILTMSFCQNYPLILFQVSRPSSTFPFILLLNILWPSNSLPLVTLFLQSHGWEKTQNSFCSLFCFLNNLLKNYLTNIMSIMD